MKFPTIFLFILTTFQVLAFPTSSESCTKELFKRKGGGGGGGRGGGGGGSSSSSRGSSSSSSSSSSGRTSFTSNTGGQTSRGSGTPPAYGGGRFYAGGATVPYTSGQRRGGFGTPLLIGAGAGGLIGGAYLYGAYAYNYPYYWNYRNQSSGRNESHPAQCYCARYQPCGCDDNNGSEYQNSVANNASIAKFDNVNGTQTLLVDGTLPNGTTASGGSDSAGVTLKHTMRYWPMIVGVLYAVFYL